MTNFAILDIDGSYTNNKQFQELPNEGHLLRMLNTLKNKRITKYDYAYKQLVTEKMGDSEDFVKEVRQTFFNFLKPFLKEVPKYIDKTRLQDDTTTVFEKYFDVKSYLASFEGEQSYPFV